jgi:hypothetical protein
MVIRQWSLFALTAVFCGCIPESSASRPPASQPSKATAAPSARDSLQSEHELLLSRVIACKQEAGEWDMRISGLTFGWREELTLDVARFLLKPGALQVVLDDLVAHPNERDRTVGNIQIAFCMSYMLYEAKPFQNLAGSGFEHAVDAGAFQTLATDNPDLRLLFFLDGIKQMVGYVKHADPNRPFQWNLNSNGGQN